MKAEPVTEASVDEAIKQLEQCMKKVDVNRESRVRLSKSEFDLLQQLEIIRNVMVNSLNDRENLRHIFGDLQRTARIRAVIATVKLSGHNATDQRIRTCMAAIVSVETLVKETRGMTQEDLDAMLEEAVQREKAALSERRSSVRLKQVHDAVAIRMKVNNAKKALLHLKDMIPTIVAVSDVTELRGMEPNKSSSLGAWMIWMVHRVYLNDPTLSSLNFAGYQMPAPTDTNADYRANLIAPKLVKAIAHNTHIEKLTLAHSNLRGPEARVLAESLQVNETLRLLDISSCMLTMPDLETVVHSVGESTIEEFRCDNQHLCDPGRTRNSALEALLEATRKNTRLVKLGLTIMEPHYLNEINKLILRNNDQSRLERRRTAAMLSMETYDHEVLISHVNVESDEDDAEDTSDSEADGQEVWNTGQLDMHDGL